MGRTNIAAAAREFAVRAHGEQRYGDEPYAVHLDEVAALVQRFGELHQAVAYLHDTVEDTGATHDQLAADFGEPIARCVAVLTAPPQLDRKARTEASHAQLAGVAADAPESAALVVKVADRLANVERCVLTEDRGRLRRYRREHRGFRAAAYRPGLADALWAELDALIATG